MRNFLFLVSAWTAGIIVATGLVSGFVYFATPQKVTLFQRDFTKEFQKLKPAQIIDKLYYKGTILNLQGQQWQFTTDQKIDLNLLQVKNGNGKGIVIAAVYIQSKAIVPAQEPKIKKGEPLNHLTHENKFNQANELTTIYLRGVAKLYFEWIDGEWYLLRINSLNLKVGPS